MAVAKGKKRSIDEIINKPYTEEVKKFKSNPVKPTNKYTGPRKPTPFTNNKNGDSYLNKKFPNKLQKGKQEGYNFSKSKFPNKNENGKLEPPNWSDIKKQKKELRTTRKISRAEAPVYDVITKAKIISEKLRRKKGTSEDRIKLTDELHRLLSAKGIYTQLALAHDTSRIIQWLLKYGSSKVREEASNELMGIIVQMIQSKYARNSVKRILKYGNPSVQNSVLTSLHGHIIKLSSHSISAPILDYAYTEVANHIQKQHLHQEFYGDIYKTTKDAHVRSLRDTYKKSPEMKTAMLGATKANLLRVLNKNVHDCGLVHAVLNDFLDECSADDRGELITTLSPHVAPLSNSKPGVQVTAMCVWQGTNKDRKTVLKVVKEHAVALSTHEHGHLLILAILSSVDDTVLVGKLLVGTLVKEAKVIAKNEWGRKVLLWLVTPGNAYFFHPSLTRWLLSNTSQGNSKKPSEVRASELLVGVIPELCKNIQEDPAHWLNNASIFTLTIAILKAASGEYLQMALDSVSKRICQPDWKIKETDEVLAIENAGIHACLKQLTKHDKINIEKKKPTFGESISKSLFNGVVKLWIESNRGCFFLISLFENNQTEVQNTIKELVLPIINKLKKMKTAGANLLMEKITKGR